VRKSHFKRKEFEFFLSRCQTKRERKRKEKKNSQKTQRSLFLFHTRKMNSEANVTNDTTDDTTSDNNNTLIQMLNLLHELYADGKLSAASYEGYRQRIINSALGRKKRKKPQCKWCNQYMEGHIDDLCPRGKARKRNAAATPRSEDPMRGVRSPAPPPITPLNPAPLRTNAVATTSPTSTSISSSLSHQASFLEKWLAALPSSQTVPSIQNQKDVDRHCIFVAPTKPPLPRGHLALFFIPETVSPLPLLNNANTNANANINLNINSSSATNNNNNQFLFSQEAAVNESQSSEYLLDSPNQ